MSLRWVKGWTQNRHELDVAHFDGINVVDTSDGFYHHKSNQVGQN